MYVCVVVYRAVGLTDRIVYDCVLILYPYIFVYVYIRLEGRLSLRL